jgi:hypothetical protein
MTKTDTGAVSRATLSARSGVSRKTLTAKAIKAAKAAEPGEALEDSFPPAPSATAPDQPDQQEPAVAPNQQAPAQQPAAGVTWSDEDEASLKALMARRKAAGFQRRGRDVSAQLLKPGKIQPNPDTVAATIVGLIGERTNITRSELLGLMASATFPHPKAQPQDKGWCQGYVAGLIRNGFLIVAEDASAPAAKVA